MLDVLNITCSKQKINSDNRTCGRKAVTRNINLQNVNLQHLERKQNSSNLNLTSGLLNLLKNLLTKMQYLEN